MDLQTIKNKLNSRAEEVFSRLGMVCEKLGDNIYSTCPVHDDSDNPRAFSFSMDKGIWKCWTRDCQHQYRNDIFGLIRGSLSKNAGEDVGFSKALKWSCEFLSIKSNIVSTKSEYIKEDYFIDLISSINNQPPQINHKPIQLENLEYPSKYFISRGFKRETLEHFGVGDCHNKSSKMYDRAVIPIHSDDGKNIVAIIGRTLKEYKMPKFLFYPKGFVKSDLFYNYHRAVDNIKSTNTVILVEGQGDVWKLYEAGIHNALGMFGKSLSKEQELKLNKLPITNIVLLTDNDQAGREAKLQITRQLNRLYTLSFPRISTKDIGEMTVQQIKDNILPQLKGSHT